MNDLNMPQPPVSAPPVAGNLPWVSWFSTLTKELKAWAAAATTALTPTTPVALTLGANWGAVAGVQAAQSFKVGDMVQVRGSIKNTAGIGLNETLATLPTGSRPPAALYFALPTSVQYDVLTVKIGADGTIKAVAADANIYTFVSLDGIGFLT